MQAAIDDLAESVRQLKFDNFDYAKYLFDKAEDIFSNVESKLILLFMLKNFHLCVNFDDFLKYAIQRFSSTTKASFC